MNDCYIEGNLTREPEARAVKDRTVIAFSIAHNNRVKNDAGEYVDGEPDFFDCEYWTEKPTYWLQRLAKGVAVVVHAEAKQDRWEKDGTKHSRIKFRLSEPPMAKWLPEIGTTSETTANTQEGKGGGGDPF